MLYVLLFSLLFAGSGVSYAQAQTDSLKLVDTAHPESFTEGEPDTVSFTFNMPIDTSVNYHRYGPLGFWRIFPMDSVEVDSISVSEDLKTINYLVNHRTASDYTWVLENARSTDSTYLQRPHKLFYSLKSGEPERYSVSGEAIAASRGKRRAGDDNSKISGYRLDTLGGPSLNYPSQIVVLTSQQPPGYFQSFDPSSVKYAYVNLGTSITFEYKIKDVIEGRYWVSLLSRAKHDSSKSNWTLYHGFHDPDFDENPDPIVIDDGNLTGIDVSGKRTTIKKHREQVGDYRLEAYPNPFNPTTSIQMDIDKDGRYSIKVYNMMGRRIKSIIDNKKLSEGSYTYKLNMANHSSGAYIISLTSDHYRTVTKVNYIK